MQIRIHGNRIQLLKAYNDKSSNRMRQEVIMSFDKNSANYPEELDSILNPKDKEEFNLWWQKWLEKLTKKCVDNLGSIVEKMTLISHQNVKFSNHTLELTTYISKLQDLV